MNNFSKKNPDTHNSILHSLVYFIFIFLAIGLIAFTLFYYVEKNISDIKQTEFESKMTNIVEIESSLLAKEFDSVISDLNYLSNSYSTHLTNAIGIEETENAWLLFSESRMIYDQVRYIDINGDEIIRINYSNSNAYAVESENLQNKKDRYYFYEAIDLNEGQIFVSRFDLNIENGEIEQPLKPMVRFCAPVFNDSDLLGVIVLNYLAEGILNEFEGISSVIEGEMYLLNSTGYYLSGTDEEKLWSFMYDDTNDITFAAEYPSAWLKINEGENSTQNEDGFFAFSRVALEDKFMINVNQLNRNDIVLDEGSWIVVSHIPANTLLENGVTLSQSEFIKSIIRKYFVYFIFIFILSLMLAFIGTITKKVRERIKFHSEYDIMTNALNRRAGLEKLQSQIPSNSKRRTRICITFIDVNGLKEVNDKLGHDKGDELIITVAKTINDSIRKEDFLIRMGGDEFLIVLDNSTYEESQNIWTRIVSRFETINQQEARPYVISVSHGLVELDEWRDNDIDTLIKIADERMYTEKKKIKAELRIIK